MQWRIQDFPEEVVPTSGVPTYYLAIFSQQLHEIEEILGRGGHSLAPPTQAQTQTQTEVIGMHT